MSARLATVNRHEITHFSAKTLCLVCGGHGQAQSVPIFPGAAAAFFDEFKRERVLLLRRLRREVKRQICNLKAWLFVRDFAGAARPSDRRMVTRKTVLQHFFDFLRDQVLVAGNRVRLLLDEKGWVRQILLFTDLHPLLLIGLSFLRTTLHKQRQPLSV